jgi:DNA-binding LacI/PurR family transcriptional regulator
MPKDASRPGATDEPDEAPPRPALRSRPVRGPTINDIARDAGVSRGTVSRVLNGGHYVSPAASAAVQKAIKNASYVANHSARSLVTRRVNAVAFVISEPHDRFFEDPNFSVLVRTATEELAANDMSLFLSLNRSPEDHRRILRFIKGGYVDGALLASTHGDDPIFSELERSHIPAVVCGKPLGHENTIAYVAADDRGGAAQMVRYLLDKGYARIAMITGPQNTSGGRDRLAGYEETLGSRVRRRLIMQAESYSVQAGHDAMKALLSRSRDIDAVFVASDLLAIGAMDAIHQAGLSVPNDIAVSGFDDSRVAPNTDPPLTTVHQPLEQVAREMVQLLLRLYSGAETSSVLLPTYVVERAST